MKKLILLPILLIAFACSSDEMDESNSRTTDPFIGNWEMFYQSEKIFDLKVNPNGTFEKFDDGDGFWLNTSATTNFDSKLQSYKLTFDTSEVYTFVGSYNENFIQFNCTMTTFEGVVVDIRLEKLSN